MCTRAAWILSVQAVQKLAPLCQLLNQDATMRTMLSLFIPQLRLDSQAIKLQCNAGMTRLALPVLSHNMVSPILQVLWKQQIPTDRQLAHVNHPAMSHGSCCVYRMHYVEMACMYNNNKLQAFQLTVARYLLGVPKP